MDRASPALAEPSLPQSGEARALRRLGLAALVLLVATGAWVRFSDRIANWAPQLAAPGSASPQSDRVQGLLELGLAPAASESAAIQALQLPAGDAAALQAAVERRRLRLVRLPLYERDGGSGGTVQVEAAGLTQLVQLSAAPVTVAIPVAHAGTLTLRLLGPAPAGGLGIGAITLTGPVSLPTLAAGDLLKIGIVAQ